MAKKRSCRRTADEDKIHEKAVKMRKMTDEQLAHYVEDRVEKARSEGFNQGKKSSGGADINKFLKEISSIKGERSQPMIKTWFKEYEKIKDKAVVVYPYECDCMSEKQRNKILSKKTVIMSGESEYACKYYEIIGNVNNLSDHDCAIIADGGNLCFGYRMEGQRIVVYTD